MPVALTLAAQIAILGPNLRAIFSYQFTAGLFRLTWDNFILRTMMRMVLAYGLSVAFALGYGMNVETLCREVLEIWREPTKVTDTFIMVTHNVHEAVFMADRIIVLRARPGRVVADIQVDLPRPREKVAHTEEFYKYEQKIISLIEQYSATTTT